MLTRSILQGGVQWYANCGFSFRCSVFFGQECSSKYPDNMCHHSLEIKIAHPI